MFYSRILLFLFATTVLATGVLQSQQPPDFRLLSVDDGLSHRDVKYVTRDARGFLWIINSGIDFYDGQSITSYHQFDPDHYIPVSNIRTGFKLWDSLLVFSASKDLYALNMITGQVRPMRYPDGMDTTFNDLVNIVDRQHHPNILFFTRSRSGTTIHVADRNWNFLFKYEVKQSESLHSKVLRSYANGPDGVLWFLDEDKEEILRIDENGKTTFPVSLQSTVDNLPYRFVFLPGSGLVICSSDGHVYRWTTGSQGMEEVMQIPNAGGSVNPFHVDRNGWVWCLSQNGLAQLNLATNTLHTFDITPFGAGIPTLRGSFEDAEGITWIPSEIGLLEFHPDPKPFRAVYVPTTTDQPFQFRDILQGEDNSVYCKVFTNETALIELRWYSDGKTDTRVLKEYIPKTGMFIRHEDYIYHVVSDQAKLLRYHLSDFSEEVIDLPIKPAAHYHNQFLIDTDGTVYYQDINNYLTAFHPRTKAWFTIQKESYGLQSPWRVIQFVGKDQFLIGTETAGLMLYDKLTGTLIRKFDTESPKPLSGNYINAVLQESDSILWVGTLGSGINRIHLITGDVRIFTTRDGLSNNLIASMVMDDTGNIWIGTYGGLSMYSKADHRFYNYYVDDGLSDNEFNYRSVYKAPDGTLLMGTLNGVTIFNPANFTANEPLPPVQLTRVEKYNRRTDQVTVQDKVTEISSRIEISPYDNYVDLSFAVPGYKTNTSHMFSSRLVGVEVEWQNHGRNSTIRYQKLPAGNYTLELMAVDANGNKTEHPTAVNIHVQQIFYKSSWFLTLLALLILGAIYSFYRYRLGILRKELQTRTRIASDLHDEVGGSLTGLYLQLQMLEMKASDQEKSHLAKVNTIINESITKMRDLVWSIDARSDSWDKILERMEDFASDVLSPLDIRFAFHRKLDPAEQLNARIKHNLYLIYKEAIHNIAKHSNARHVDIHLERQNGQLILNIHDDGKPDENKSSLSGQGLQNMTMRARRLNGVLNAKYVDDGFEVSLQVPFKAER